MSIFKTSSVIFTNLSKLWGILSVDKTCFLYNVCVKIEGYYIIIYRAFRADGNHWKNYAQKAKRKDR